MHVIEKQKIPHALSAQQRIPSVRKKVLDRKKRAGYAKKKSPFGKRRISVKVRTVPVPSKKERTKTPLQITDFARFKHIQTRLSNR